MKIRALHVNIFGDGTNCSNNGVSRRYADAYVVCPEGNYEFDTEDAPENLLVIEDMRGHKFARPFKEPEHLGWMFGGSLVYTSDSRFRRMSEYPLCLHDRQETQAQYDALSR